MAKRDPFRGIPLQENRRLQVDKNGPELDDAELGGNGIMLRSPGEFILDPELLHRELGLLALHTEAESTYRKLTQLTERTGMPITQENGQRCYGPPLDPTVPAPVRGSEVFVGKLPRNCYEPDLVPIFEKAGRIYELRLMMDFSGTNRGYCFVLYFTPAEADYAVRVLNNYEIRAGHRIGVVKSVDNCRLSIFDIPKDKDEFEIRQEMEKLTEAVVGVGVRKPVDYPVSKNSGSAIVEYESHKAAAMARRKLVPGNVKLRGCDVGVDWAEPDLGPHILRVKNLSPRTSDETLKQLFYSVSGNGVLDVKKCGNHAFIDFRTRWEAEVAKEAIDKAVIDGCEVRVVWAKGKVQRKGNKVRIEFDTTRSFKLERNRDDFKEMILAKPRNGYERQRDRHHDQDGHVFQARGQLHNNQMQNTLGGFRSDVKASAEGCFNGGPSQTQFTIPMPYSQGYQYQNPGYTYANTAYQYPSYQLRLQQQQQPSWNPNTNVSLTASSQNPYYTEYSPFFQYDANYNNNSAGYNGYGYRSNTNTALPDHVNAYNRLGFVAPCW